VRGKNYFSFKSNNKEDSVMNPESKTTFSITQVSEKTGVSKNRIREWHKKGFLPEVQSISVGSRFHRRFTEKDREIIQRINDYQKQGFVLQIAVEKAREGRKED
jgi:predicted DNA-binding transcriptional regulator AlpA